MTNREDDKNENNDETPEEHEPIEDARYPEPDYSIDPWSGTMATDSSNDTVGTNKDFFHELNTFNNIVVVRYSGETATTPRTGRACATIALHIQQCYKVAP